MRMILMFLTALTLSASAAVAGNLPADPTTFASALAKAKGGDVILAAPGVYTGASFRNLSFSPQLKITSADPAHPARFTSFVATNVHGVRFSDLEMVAKAPSQFDFGASKSSDIHFDHVSVHGSIDGDPTNDAGGIGIEGSSNISITNSEFQQLKRGLAISTTTGVTLTGNHIHDVETTGVVMAAVTNVKISKNVFHDFFPLKEDHPDAIQFATRGQSQGSKHIEVSGNLIFAGVGRATQGIFFRDQIETMPFEDISITDNLVVGTGYGGILIIGAKDVTIRGNELVSNPGDTHNTWILVQNADRVAASDNRAQTITIETSSHVTENKNKRTGTVKDGGAEALARWAAKPEFQALVGPFVRSAAAH